MADRSNRPDRPARRGFTLVELGAVLAVSATLGAALMPMARKSRVSAQAQRSASNLSVIGQGAGMYGLDNADRIPGYSFTRESVAKLVGVPPQGRVEYTLPNGDRVTLRSDVDAVAAQNTEILQRRTGRLDGPFGIRYERSRLWHRRWSHLVLVDYLGSPFEAGLFIDPADTNQLTWTANPLDYDAGSTVPYANGLPPGEFDTNWTREGVRQRWAFGASYQSTVSAWNPDGIDEPSYVPISDTPHLFRPYFLGAGQGSGVTLDLSGREFSEVAFPSGKVYFFEEFDREQPGDPYFAYDHARPEKLMFDGSVNSFASGEAGVSANAGEGVRNWRQRYVPLDTFPTELPGREGELLSQRYRWTLGGLRGVDYAQPASSRRGLRSR